MGATALIAGAIGGNIEVIKLLIDAKSDVNAKSNDGSGPLFYCAAKGDAAGVKVLLENKANVNAVNNNGETALMRAAFGGYTGVVKALLAKKADTELESEEGSTALIFAADNGHVEVVKALLDNGANKNHSHRYSPGKKPHDYARLKGFSEVEELLKPEADQLNKKFMEMRKLLKDAEKKPKKKLGAKEQAAANQQLMDAIKKNFLPAVCDALDSGADPNATIDGKRPIIEAVGRCPIEILELLINEGADVNVEDDIDRRAITVACGGGFADKLKLLLDNGAEVKKVYIVANEKISKMLAEKMK
jgi:ankyrin repeat protein